MIIKVTGEAMNADFIQERITKTKALIVAYEDAVTALVETGAQSYTIDTMQTKQTVTKFDLDKLNTSLDGLYNRLATLQARLSGAGQIIVRPGF